MKVNVKIWWTLHLTILLLQLLKVLTRPHSFMCTILNILVELLNSGVNFKWSLRNVGHDDSSVGLIIARS